MTTLLVLALATAVVAACRGMWSPCGLSMLSSLNPVSERSRGNRFWLTTLWYVAGALAGGAALGAGCAVAAFGLARTHLGAGTTWTLVLVAAAVAAVSDSSLLRVSLPDHPRQVDERWLSAYRRWIYAGGYGVQIGTGFSTYIMTATVYLTAALAVLTAAPGAAFAVGVSFGLARGLAIFVTAGVSTPEQLRTVLARVDRLGPLSLRVCGVVAAIVAVTAAGMLGGAVPAAITAAPTLALALAHRSVRRVAAPAGTGVA